MGPRAGLDRCRKSRSRRDSIAGPSNLVASLYNPLRYPALTALTALTGLTALTVSLARGTAFLF